MAGRKPKPLEVIIGGGGKHLTKEEIEARRLAEASLQPSTDKIRCPTWLDDVGRKEWRRIVRELEQLKLMTNIDVAALALYCDAYSKYLEASMRVKDEGVMIEFTNKAGATNMMPHPAVAVMHKMAQLIRAFGSEFGLSPSARLRLTLPKQGGKEPTDLEKNGFGDV